MAAGYSRSKGGGDTYHLGVYTWTALIALSTAGFTTGRTKAWVSTFATEFVWNGTRWRTPAKRLTVFLSTAVAGQTSAPGTAEAVLAGCQASLPAGLCAVNDLLEVTFSAVKSGSAETATILILIGTAGTTADASFSGAGIDLTTANDCLTGKHMFRITSATAAQKLAAGATGVNPYTSSATDQPGAITVGNFTSAAQFLTLTNQQSGTAEWVVIKLFRVILEYQS